MGPPTFRAATSDDVDAVVDLVESAYRGDRSRAGWNTEADVIDGQRVDEDMLRAALARTDTTIVLLHQDGDLVGCCELRRDAAGRTVSLGMFAVDPTRQDGGFGRLVLAEAERLSRDEWGAERIEMSVIDLRVPLIEWYERRGYRRTGATLPFPYGDERYGLPRRDDLRFAVLEKVLEPDRADPT